MLLLRRVPAFFRPAAESPACAGACHLAYRIASPDSRRVRGRFLHTRRDFPLPTRQVQHCAARQCPHATRAGTAVLHSVGLGELAAESPAEYVRTARELAGNPAKLSCMRDGMRQRMLGSPLLDGKRLARDVEAAYRWMWAQWCAGDQTISEERS